MRERLPALEGLPVRALLPEGVRVFQPALNVVDIAHIDLHCVAELLGQPLQVVVFFDGDGVNFVVYLDFDLENDALSRLAPCSGNTFLAEPRLLLLLLFENQVRDLLDFFRPDPVPVGELLGQRIGVILQAHRELENRCPHLHFQDEVWASVRPDHTLASYAALE